MWCATETCGRWIPAGAPECPVCGWAVPGGKEAEPGSAPDDHIARYSSLTAHSATQRNRATGLSLVAVVVGVAIALTLSGLSEREAPSSPLAVSVDPTPIDPESSTETTTASPNTDTSTSSPSSAVGGVPSLTYGTWVTVVDSLPTTSHGHQEALERAQLYGPQVRVVRSDDHTPDLRPGYWALLIIDQPTEAAARASCSDVGKTVGDTCYPKFIDDAVDPA